MAHSWVDTLLHIWVFFSYITAHKKRHATSQLVEVILQVITQKDSPLADSSACSLLIYQSESTLTCSNQNSETLTMMDQLQRANEANWQWMSLLQMHSIFFNPLQCRTSTMAQVPTLDAKSFFEPMQLSLSSTKTLFRSGCNCLKPLFYCIWRCQSPTTNNSWSWAGYGDYYYRPMDPGEWLQERMVRCNNGDNGFEVFKGLWAYLHWLSCCS